LNTAVQQFPDGDTHVLERFPLCLC